MSCLTAQCATSRTSRAERPALPRALCGGCVSLCRQQHEPQQRQQRTPKLQQAAAAQWRRLGVTAAAASSNGAQPAEAQERQQQHASIQHPLFPEAQPAAVGPLLVQTQRGIPAFRPVIPDRPCPHCGGTGKTTCGDCRGKGRLNYRSSSMLPQGVWPQWCPACRASGRWCCAQCMGTGVKRQPIGFRLPHEEEEGDD